MNKNFRFSIEHTVYSDYMISPLLFQKCLKMVRC